MSLLQLLALVWGVSGREVQRTLGRGVSGFRREGRDHYRAVGPLTAARLRRTRPLDARLPIALWLSGNCTLWEAARLCEEGIVAAAAQARPHIDQASVVILALETRMAVDFKAENRGHYLRRQETAALFDDYRRRIVGELAEAEAEPDFAAVRNSVRRLMNRGVPIPIREESAAEMGISLRTHVTRYPGRVWRRARIAADVFMEVKTPVDVMLDAMERLAEEGIDASEDSVAEELGYECAEILFRYYTRGEFAEAKARFEGATIARVPSFQAESNDTGQEGRRVNLVQSGDVPI
jgi:hypothetical protein